MPLRANGYEFSNGVFTNGEPFRPKIIAPSGGILANAIDLARWFEAVLQGRVVKPSGLQQMLAPARLADGGNVAHGFAFFTDTFNGHKMIFHHGSTVGGFGSVVRYFPDERITIAVMGNLEDGGWGPDYIIKRVAGFYIPGSFIGGLKDSNDPEPAISKSLLQLLNDLAAGKDNDTLSPSYRPRISDAIRKEIAANLKDLQSFSFLAKEKIGTDHFVLDKTLVTARHYRLKSAKKTIYYTFRLDENGKVGFIVADQD